MTYRDWFDGIRSEVRSIAEAEAELAAIRETLGVKAQRYGAGVQGGTIDQMAQVDSIIERERALDVKRARVNADIDHALTLLYGEEQDGKGGLARARGNIYADAVCGVYLMGQKHREVAEELGCTKSWVTNLCTMAFSYMDRRMG